MYLVPILHRFEDDIKNEDQSNKDGPDIRHPAEKRRFGPSLLPTYIIEAMRTTFKMRFKEIMLPPEFEKFAQIAKSRKLHNH